MADVQNRIVLSAEPERLDLASPDVIDLDAPEVVEVAPRRWWPWTTWVIVGLVIALLAAVGAGVWLYRDRTSYQSSPAWAAVSEYVDAVNAQDIDRLRMATTDDIAWTGYDPRGAVVATYEGEGYLLFQQQFFPTFRLELLGPPTILGSNVAVPVHVSGPLGVNYDALTVFALRTVGGEPTVSAIMAVPAG